MLLLTNGTIATMDPARPMAEAAVVDGAYFAYVGGRADAEDFTRRFSRGAWETLDLQGRFVMPGFNDSHLHFIHYVKTKLSVNLFGHRSSKAVDFIALNDGSTIKNIQIVVDPTKFDAEMLKQALR